MNGVNDYDNFDGPTSAYVKRNRKPVLHISLRKCFMKEKKLR